MFGLRSRTSWLYPLTSWHSQGLFSARDARILRHIWLTEEQKQSWREKYSLILPDRTAGQTAIDYTFKWTSTRSVNGELYEALTANGMKFNVAFDGRRGDFTQSGHVYQAIRWRGQLRSSRNLHITVTSSIVNANIQKKNERRNQTNCCGSSQFSSLFYYATSLLPFQFRRTMPTTPAADFMPNSFIFDSGRLNQARYS